MTNGAGRKPGEPTVPRSDVEEVLEHAVAQAASQRGRAQGQALPDPTEDPAPLPQSIPREDIDDVIGKADELARADDNEVSLTELKEIAAEVDVPAEAVEDAVEALAAERKAAAQQAERERQLEATRKVAARQRMKRVLMVVAALFVMLVIWGVMGGNSLKSDLNEVEQQRAQVVSVMDRQTRIREDFADGPSSLDRDAEIAGAENRVRIEMQRYDEAASAYNARVEGFPNSVWRGLFGLPDHMPLSNEPGFLEAAP